MPIEEREENTLRTQTEQLMELMERANIGRTRAFVDAPAWRTPTGFVGFADEFEELLILEREPHQCEGVEMDEDDIGFDEIINSTK